MNTYLDLVICTHTPLVRKYLFRAPAFSGLKLGDSVIVETKRGDSCAEVKSVCTVPEGSAHFESLAIALDATLPLKRVLAKVVLQALDYADAEGPAQ